MSDEKKKIGEVERLIRLIEEEGITYDELAEMAEASVRTVTNTIYDNKPLGVKILRGLQKKRGVSLDWLLTGKGSMYLPTSTSVSSISTDPTVASLQTWLEHYAQTRTEREVQWLEVEISRRFPDYNRWLIEQGREPVSKPTLFDSLVGSLMRPLSPEQTRQLVELAEAMEKENSQQKP